MLATCCWHLELGTSPTPPCSHTLDLSDLNVCAKLGEGNLNVGDFHLRSRSGFRSRTSLSVAKALKMSPRALSLCTSIRLKWRGIYIGAYNNTTNLVSYFASYFCTFSHPLLWADPRQLRADDDFPLETLLFLFYYFFFSYIYGLQHCLAIDFCNGYELHSRNYEW
jgi:hypothetical protein